MMRKYKLRGPVKERYRTNLRHTVMFQSMCLRPIYEESAKEKMFRFLYDLSKKKQCIIKIRNTFNRVLTVQKKFRKSIYKSLYDQARLSQNIFTGLNTIRVMFIKDKTYQQSYRETLDCVNALTSTDKQVVEQIVRMFLGLANYIHQVNILRWYANFRNGGVYNSDLYYQVLNKIKELKAAQTLLHKTGEQMMPPREAIKLHSKQSLKRSITGQGTDVGSLFETVISHKETKRQYRKSLQKRLTNLFTLCLQKKLPAILPEEMKPLATPLSEAIIKKDFQELGYNLEAMVEIIQPVYNLKDGYPSQSYQVIDLVYMVLAYYKLNRTS